MKNKIIKILNEHKNEYVSGEEISQMLGCSRVAISNHIKKLREEGYEIESQTKKGYRFSANNDILNAAIIQDGLPAFYQNIELLESVDSTNQYMKKQALNLQNGDVVVADMQTAGKGRNGRHFHSPKQSGIYVSIFLKPNLSIQQSLKVTACASVAIFQTIQQNYHLDCAIKWVNDVYLQDKKIAGVLCEASLELNTASLDYMIIGMGINVHSYTMPEDIQDIAGCVEDFSPLKIERNRLLHDLLQHFYTYYTQIEENTFLPIYKQNSYVLFQDIIVHEKNKTYEARVLDIDENANLIIQKKDKSLSALSSGEISIRKQKERL